jgi:hypothetical protein
LENHSNERIGRSLLPHEAEKDRRGGHGGHDPLCRTPSRSDIAQPLGITVHDHVTVGKEGYASRKALKLI